MKKRMTEALGADVIAGAMPSMWYRNNLNATALKVEGHKPCKK